MINEEHIDYLQAMGVPVWQRRADIVEKSKNIEKESSWNTLKEEVKCCNRCGLDKTRTHTVFGVGSEESPLLIIGEAPGASEDKQGLPFVGRAGQLLTEMLKAIAIERESIYITNILKCRPPNNRDPLPYEVECCTPYLKKQIEMIQPKLIVAVGRIAAQFLLNTKESLGRLRGKLCSYGEENIPLIVTYHPAYLLRSPREKAKAYEDLLKIQEFLRS